MNRRRFLANGIAAGAFACVEPGAGSIQSMQAQSAARPHDLVSLGAKPDPVLLNLNRTAVLVVDMQNDFCSMGGLMDAQGFNVAIIQSIVPNIRTVLAAARKTGLKIVYLQMAYKPDLSDLGPEGSPNWNANRLVGTTVKAPHGAAGRMLIRGTWNTDVIEGLKPQPGDITLYKTRFSGFYRPTLTRF
jgi:ureidoacrylate peracid hydrolase